MIRGHTEPILDFDFFPYNDNYVASSSGDGTIKIWNIPENLNDIGQECLATLYGHKNKVNLIKFN